MKNRTILFAFFLLLVSIGYSQTCTVGYPPPSDNCATAPAIQLNGVYCGNTCNATANDAAWFKHSNEFCNSVSKQTIENNGFYIFQATASSVNFTICTKTGCTRKNNIIGASGIQALIFNFPTANGLGTCGSGSIDGYYCLKQLSGTDCGSCSNPKGCLSASVNGLSAGKFYYFMVDGYEGDCCDFSIQFTSNITLPVELISFKGKGENAGNHLFWSTASEKNNDYFNIESSTDATNWRTINSIKGHGNTNQLKNYDFIDLNPAAVITYYRLMQVDYDGSFSYSPIIFVDRSATGSLSIFPNPFNSELNLQFNISKGGLYTLTFNSMLGKQIQKQIDLKEGQSLAKIDFSDNLTSGAYMVEVANESGEILQHVKLIKY